MAIYYRNEDGSVTKEKRDITLNDVIEQKKENLIKQGVEVSDCSKDILTTKSSVKE